MNSRLIQIPLSLCKLSKVSIQRQIVIQIAQLIERGLLSPGAQLPSIRSLSREHGVAKNTAILAYQRLESEGWITIRQGASIKVSEHPPIGRPSTLREHGYTATEEQDHAEAPVLARIFNPPRENSSVSYEVDFRLGATAAELFPREAWQHWSNILIRYASSNTSHYLDSQGLPDLRAAIVEHVGVSRGIDAKKEDVVIVHGIQEALSITASLLLDDKCRVLVESPCYRGAHNIFSGFGAQFNYLPVDKEGINPSEIPAGIHRLLHVTPSHQFPLGVTLGADRRNGLVEWAREHNSYILENDYDADFRYVDSPLAAMASIDKKRVIYMGTFSKTLGPSLRLGYMICPPALTGYVRKAKALLNNGCSWLDQAVVSRLMANGEFAAHLRSVRHYYKERQNLLISVLGKYGGNIMGEGGGSHICWELPPWAPDAKDVEAKLKVAGIKVYTSEEVAVWGAPHDKFERLLFLGFGSTTDHCISKLDQALENIFQGISH